MSIGCDIKKNDIESDIKKHNIEKHDEKISKKAKKVDHLRVGSYNIVATYFSDPKDENDKKYNMPHAWAKRKMYIKDAFDRVSADVIALQEMSPEQALDLVEMFQEHKFFFFVQAQTDEIESGSIYSTHDEIKKHLLGKFIGTALIGIMYDPKIVTAKYVNMFWYNPDPFTRPLSTDRSLTDKGFGNMNTPRGPGYVKFNHISSGKDFYFFTSHAPLSGGWKTRGECFKLERKIIKEIVGTDPFFSVGDRNMLPDEGFDETYKVLVSDGAYDWLNPENHEGAYTTWIGFLYEPEHIQNYVHKGKTIFKRTERLDIGISSLKSIKSAHYHCVIRDDGVKLLGELTEKDNLIRNFLSDHSMVVADYEL
jgi:hypothetical protein